MINAIRFVKGSVAKKDYVAELTHFLIKDGRITGFNGVIGLSSPIDIDIDARPKATVFANAITKCDETIAMHMTKAGRLSIKSGKFRALIDCMDDVGDMIPTVPDGHEIDVGSKFMDAIRAVEKYQGVDASRPWALGMLFHGPFAYATNNVMFVQYWHGHNMPFDMQIPAAAVKELLRINQEPVRVTATDHSMTFHYKGERWLRTALIEQSWPDNAIGLLDIDFDYKPIPEDFFEGLLAIKPFLDKDERLHFRDGQVSTSQHKEIGVSYDIIGLPEPQTYPHKVLALLEGATTIDFDPYPAPCGFLAPGMRGIFMGLRMTKNSTT